MSGLPVLDWLASVPPPALRRPARRRSVQTEKSLQEEILLRLRPYPIIAIAVPNSVYIRTDTEDQERTLGQVIGAMKRQGGMTPGAPDLVLLWAYGAGCVELKRPASIDLLGRRRPAGRPSSAQRSFEAECRRCGVHFCYADGWEGTARPLKPRLIEWGAING